MEQPVKTVKIELTVNQINTVLASLAKQPLEAVLDTFSAIRSQAESQVSSEPQLSSEPPLAAKVIKD